MDAACILALVSELRERTLYDKETAILLSSLEDEALGSLQVENVDLNLHTGVHPLLLLHLCIY
jgi:hypothetical protein